MVLQSISGAPGHVHLNVERVVMTQQRPGSEVVDDIFVFELNRTEEYPNDFVYVDSLTLTLAHCLISKLVLETVHLSRSSLTYSNMHTLAYFHSCAASEHLSAEAKEWNRGLMKENSRWQTSSRFES